MKIPFGKYEGVKIEDLPDHYIEWFLEQGWTMCKYPAIYFKLQSMDNELSPLSIGKQRIDKLTKYFNDESKKLRSQRRLADAAEFLRGIECEV